jgi:putative hydrolase of the HAD superfamily
VPFVVRALILDLGGVFIGLDPERPMSRFCQTFKAVSPEDLVRVFRDTDLRYRYETGRIGTQAFYEEVKRKLSCNFSLAFFEALWVDMFYPIQPMIDLLPAINRRYRLVLLSNTNPLHMDYCRRHFDIFGYFHDLVLSYQVGAAKPEETAYRIVLERNDLTPEECLFIDDTPENARAAAGLGIDAFVFEGVDSFRRWGQHTECVSARTLLLGEENGHA